MIPQTLQVVYRERARSVPWPVASLVWPCSPGFISGGAAGPWEPLLLCVPPQRTVLAPVQGCPLPVLPAAPLDGPQRVGGLGVNAAPGLQP